MKRIIIPVLLAAGITACNNNNSDYDASGTFETTESIISAEASGIIKQFDIEEGQVLKAGQYVGYIDSVQLYLKKKQLEAQIKAMGYKLPDIAAQTAQFKQQAAVAQSDLNHLLNEKKRIFL